MKRECEWCRASVVSRRADARYCSGACRVAAHRQTRTTPIPRTMLQNNRWIRHSKTKVPLTTQGNAASSTNPATWTNYTNAKASNVGAGLGYVLGDGIGCIDLDHCYQNGQPNETAQRFLTRYPGNYIEVSPSGDGLHIWGTLPEGHGTKRNISGLSIETYSVGRYITITGNVYQPGALLPL